MGKTDTKLTVLEEREPLQTLQDLIKNPNTIGVLELLTGVISTAVAKPSDLILSGGRLTQALFKGSLYQQLYTEVHKYRREGKISDENLNSKYGKNIFVELMRTIDEAGLDDEKFDALKAIFLNSISHKTDKQSQVLAYQYFQVLKKLSSLNILILKTVYGLYLDCNRPDFTININSYRSWEQEISKRLDVPVELVTMARLQYSNVSSQPEPYLYLILEGSPRKEDMHGLTGLGISLGKHITTHL